MLHKTNTPNPLNFFNVRRFKKKPKNLRCERYNFESDELGERVVNWIDENLKSRYDYFLAESPDGIYSTDKDGNITYFNKSAARMLNYDSGDQLLGKNIAEEFYYSPHDRDKLLSNIAK